MIFWICFWIIFLPMVLIFPIKKVGKQNLKELKGKNFILACNHMSNLDAIMLDIKLFKKFRYLAKKELFKKKFTGAFMRSLGAVPVDRSQADPKAIKEIFRLIGDSKKIAIFPQGTRAKTVHIEDGSAKEGVAMFADACEELCQKVGIASNIKSQGIDATKWEESVHRMAMNAYEDQCTPANPRLPLVADMIEILKKAYNG